MKRWMIISVVLILVAFATTRLLLRTENEIDAEMQFYVHNLQYDFTAKVDSIILLNEKGVGFLVCEITGGKCNRVIEDSLNQHLTNYKRIRFLHFKEKDQFQIFVGGVSKYKPMDSIRVNSTEDKFSIYRDGQNVLESHVSHATTHKVYFAFWLQD